MSASEPLAIAVPVLNAERYLAATLSSLNAQGEFVAWWLQDGGSTDETLSIARHYARENDGVVSEADRGQADALNRAFASMGGKIVGFLNGDDMLLPGTAKRVLEFFDAHPEIDLVYGSIEWMNSEGEVTGSHEGRIQSLRELLDIYNVWWKGRQWVQPEVFFRRSLYERVGGFETGLHLAFDYDFWVRCLLAGARVAHVSNAGARFRLHAEQKSTAAERAADEIRGIVQKHLPVAPIGLWDRIRITADLSYDLYQLGRSSASSTPKRTFAVELLRHPTWLFATAARARIQSSLAKSLPFRRRNAT